MYIYSENFRINIRRCRIHHLLSLQRLQDLIIQTHIQISEDENPKFFFQCIISDIYILENYISDYALQFSFKNNLRFPFFITNLTRFFFTIFLSHSVSPFKYNHGRINIFFVILKGTFFIHVFQFLYSSSLFFQGSSMHTHRSILRFTL